MHLKNFVFLLKSFSLGAIIFSILPEKFEVGGVIFIVISFVTLRSCYKYVLTLWVDKIALAFLIGYLLMFLPTKILLVGSMLVLGVLLLTVLFLYKKVKKEKPEFGSITYYSGRYNNAQGIELIYVKYKCTGECYSDTASVYEPTEKDIQLISEATHVEYHLFYKKIGEKVVFEKTRLAERLLAVFEAKMLKNIKI